MKTSGFVLLALAGLMLLGWLFTANDLAMRKVFAPAQEQVRRETFEQSKAYRDGMIQELRSMQFEYLRADEAHKPALVAVIRHKMAGFPEDAIPYDLKIFLNQLETP